MNRKHVIVLFFLIIFIWGTNWTVTKLIVLSIPPIWTTAIRSLIAAVALFAVQVSRHQLIIPKRHDIPAILVISIFHMVVYGAFMAIGLQYTSVGRSVVLAYTTPLWVTPAAIFFLHEPINKWKICGVLLGIVGVLILLNPSLENISNPNQIFGNSLLLAASFFWAITIIFIKAFTWHATPFQLVFWQNLLAFVLLATIALCVEGVPHFTMNINLAWQCAYNGLFAAAFGFWGMTVINQHFSAVITSLGLLLTPIVGIASSQLVLGEKLDLPLLIAAGLILFGISLGCISTGNKEI